MEFHQMPENDMNVFAELGDATVAAVVNEFYHLLVNDPRLANHFEDVDLHRVRLSHITMLVNYLFGGPNAYKGPNMRRIHKGLQITADEYEIAVRHFKTALRKYNTPIPQIAKVEALLRFVKPHIILK
jgi:hemoglobin